MTLNKIKIFMTKLPLLDEKQVLLTLVSMQKLKTLKNMELNLRYSHHSNKDLKAQ